MCVGMRESGKSSFVQIRILRLYISISLQVTNIEL